MTDYLSPARTRFLPTSDGDLAYREEGSGPPLVFLHGGFLDHRMWEQQIPAFAANHRVIAPDARGHGASANATRPFRAADDLAELIRGLDAGPAVLVGLSMGGAIAVDTALEHPELVRAIVVSGVGTSEPVFEDPWLLDAFAAQQDALEAGDVEGWVAAFMRFTVGPHRELADVAPEVVSRVNEMAVGTLLKHAPDESDHRIPVADTWNRAAGIAVPAFAINGALDTPDHLGASLRLIAAVPDGRAVAVPGAAHYPNMEEPAAFNAELASFLDRLPREAVRWGSME
ncbi:alpha/beta hydrolase [Kitasatospora sp. CM 4170]|uniref:Alpha/beta fold hydrolase n=1 Tax=Kitasatospora aburaviensis TaxID=67265 RepID=A0ABW1EZ66_9ACTN|nr:alpha/beta hydrolase [Kitasatospora sp. CM 4170]WNM49661.1 alpha/beta hydrolase [Kitasatospora sp. CM 4170]